MKTFLHLRKVIFGSLLLCITSAFNAQSGLSNLSFETWTTTVLGSTPVGWFASNVTQQTTGAQNGTKYARLSQSSNQSGFIFLGDMSHLGAPIAANPTVLTGFYKTSGMNPGDEM